MTGDNSSADEKDTLIKGNVERVPAYATSLESSSQNRGLRDSQVVDPSAETPSRAAHAGHEAGADVLQGLGGERPDDSDRTGPVEVHIERPTMDDDTVPPPSAHRADTMVRAVGSEARQHMERGEQEVNEANFTKGVNAPTVDRSRYPYSVEEMDAMLSEAPRGLFPDTPGGDGGTPLSSERETFLANMQERAHFESKNEAVRWSHAVFNALRERALAHDDALLSELAGVVRVGEAPEVQLEEMMWGGDFLGRTQRMLGVASTWSKDEFYATVAQHAGERPTNPWVDAAVFSFLGTLKSYVGNDTGIELNELQELWGRV